MLILPNRQQQILSADGQVIEQPEYKGYLSPLTTIKVGDIIFRSGNVERLYISSIFHVHKDGIMLLDITSRVK